MQRALLSEQQVHPAIREKLASYRSNVVEEAKSAIASHDVVVLGMSQNPFPRKARKLLDTRGTAYHYIEHGSYLSKWRERLPLKLWSGWPTFPMIFVKGVLIGGFEDLERLVNSGEFDTLLKAPRPQ